VGSLAADEIRNFFLKLSQRYHYHARIYILGGGALCLLGNPRRTVDIDYTLEETDEHLEELKRAIDDLAREEQLDLEAVPIQEFIPLPPGAGTRHLRMYQIGSLEIYVFDPYSIALSKLGRGFETDLQDVLYLLEKGIINLAELAGFVENAKDNAWDYDINPEELQLRLNEIREFRE